ncbi:MAG: antitoxin [Clostridiales bacterium]|nr:antitoxin [Clostridiales bacterium]
MPKKQTEWSRNYNEKAYDRLAITVPKGQKVTVEAAAKAAGESVNQYTQRALLARMGLETWPSIAEERRE